MPTVYHGTTSNFVPSILKGGLYPIPENKWNASKVNGRFNPSKDDPKDLTYFTKDAAYAAEYAKAKVRYFAANTGQTFMSMNDMLLIKGKDAPVIKNLKPEVLAVHLTDTEAANAYVDEQDFNGIEYLGNIPATRISLMPFKDAEAFVLPPDVQAEKDNREFSMFLGMMFGNYKKERAF